MRKTPDLIPMEFACLNGSLAAGIFHLVSCRRTADGSENLGHGSFASRDGCCGAVEKAIPILAAATAGVGVRSGHCIRLLQEFEDQNGLFADQHSGSAMIDPHRLAASKSCGQRDKEEKGKID